MSKIRRSGKVIVEKNYRGENDMNTQTIKNFRFFSSLGIKFNRFIIIFRAIWDIDAMVIGSVRSMCVSIRVPNCSLVHPPLSMQTVISYNLYVHNCTIHFSRENLASQEECTRVCLFNFPVHQDCNEMKKLGFVRIVMRREK